MSKKSVLIDKVILPYHPTFHLSYNETSNPEWYDVASLVEETIEHVGKIKRTNGHHCDFIDGSDCKTGTINGRSGGISRVGSSAGIPKNGLLRCVFYVKQIQDVIFYAIPKKIWLPHVKVHTTNREGQISIKYNPTTNRITTFEECECGTFEEMCCIKENEMEVLIEERTSTLEQWIES